MTDKLKALLIVVLVAISFVAIIMLIDGIAHGIAHIIISQFMPEQQVISVWNGTIIGV